MDYSIDNRTQQEQEYDRKHPLISINSVHQKDFIKSLFLKLQLKHLKKLVYNLKEKGDKQDKRILNQTEEIKRLQKTNKDLRKHLQWKK